MKTFFASVAAVTLLLLSGCSSAGIGEEAIPETVFTISREVVTPPGNGEIIVGVEETVQILNGTTVVVSVGGSSSCPPVIEKVEINKEANVVSFMIKDYPNQACTMDFGLLPQRVTAVGVGFDFNNYTFQKCLTLTNCSPLATSTV